jgi:transposase
MEEQRPAYLQQIPPEDWEKTPASAKKLVEEMAQRSEKLEKQLAELLAVHQQLLELVNRTSKNSSSPPSKDPPGFGKKPQKQKSSKKSVRHSPGWHIRATTRTERATRSRRSQSGLVPNRKV